MPARTWAPAMSSGTPIDGLFELNASALGLPDDVYHYWFEVENTSPGGSGRIQVPDPLASVVDYRLYAPANPSVIHPASVIGLSGGTLVVRPVADSELKKATRVVTSADTTSITLKPTRAGKRYLKRHGTLKVRARFTFTPCGGAGSSVTHRFTLKMR